ncbi:virulence RhuM family protein [Gallionella capsiferriformans]|uniref:Virulence protein n=1 Tax=Gallionella capsiferriformans (strain ES-2) TaxID=395494 RepID=D9SFZ2_GALCS|nr:virulence RhuM family protein [Gallionella capsiferriformans]ADL55439.1 virulence protein [Gallionella capsiferriformans ES-2]
MPSQANQQNLIIYHTADGQAAVSLYARDGNIWMNQNQLAELFSTSKQNVSLHINNILKEKELQSDSVIKDYLTTAADGKDYRVTFYALDMILAIGFRVRSPRGTEFRKWANAHLKQYLIKGFVMDDERLKNPDGRADYFDELLERIREIRTSELRFYQKVRDLLALSSDYDASDKATQMFFAETQNKLLYAVTQHTAAEIIVQRADASAPNMNLQSFKGSVVRKGDITVAKNYLNADEVDSLNRLTVIFLETAELRVKERKDLTLPYWRDNVDKLLTFNDKPVLSSAGRISHAQMEKQVNSQYAKFDARRKTEQALAADAQELEELNAVAEVVKKRGGK